MMHRLARPFFFGFGLVVASFFFGTTTNKNVAEGFSVLVPTTRTRTFVVPTAQSIRTVVNVDDNRRRRPRSTPWIVVGRCVARDTRQARPTTTRTPTQLHLSSDPNTSEKSPTSNVPFWLDPGTKGGVIVYTILLFVVPLALYNFVVSTGLADEISAGRWIGVGFTVAISLAWVSTYVFRVATKDMTYAKQLKDYENAVIAKRLEELDEDEIQALVEEVERDDF